MEEFKNFLESMKLIFTFSLDKIVPGANRGDQDQRCEERQHHFILLKLELRMKVEELTWHKEILFEKDYFL